MISAIILAAGESRRMGQPKMLLPWGETTVLGQVVATFASAEIGDIIAVTGGNREDIRRLIEELATRYPVREVYNSDYARGGMLSSIQCGLRELLFAQPPPSRRTASPISMGKGGGKVGAALIGLGDQPQVREDTVLRICSAFDRNGASLVVPSFENHRGHPWLAARSFWQEIMALPVSINPRQFLQTHETEVEYIAADESIMQDLDTPQDYAKFRP
jgi:molybdenum cofactor cytidylyltransferase